MSEKKYHKRFAGHDLNRRRNTAAHIGADLSGWLAAHGMRPQQTLLGQLWRNWDIVMGPDIAPIARPLGHRNGIPAPDSLLNPVRGKTFGISGGICQPAVLDRPTLRYIAEGSQQKRGYR